MPAAVPSLHRSLRLALGVAALAGVGGTGTAAAGAPSGMHFVPVNRPLIVVRMPSLSFGASRPKERGYLPAVGPSELRWRETPNVATATARPSPAVFHLYDPPAEKPAADPTAEAKAPVVDTPPAEPAKPAARPATAADSPLRAEDFLPFFQKPADARAPADEGEPTPFVPATSKAEYKRQ